jgi:hypothetical protein
MWTRIILIDIQVGELRKHANRGVPSESRFRLEGNYSSTSDCNTISSDDVS